MHILLGSSLRPASHMWMSELSKIETLEVMNGLVMATNVIEYTPFRKHY